MIYGVVDTSTWIHKPKRTQRGGKSKMRLHYSWRMYGMRGCPPGNSLSIRIDANTESLEPKFRDEYKREKRAHQPSFFFPPGSYVSGRWIFMSLAGCLCNPVSQCSHLSVVVESGPVVVHFKRNGVSRENYLRLCDIRPKIRASLITMTYGEFRFTSSSFLGRNWHLCTPRRKVGNAPMEIIPEKEWSL